MWLRKLDPYSQYVIDFIEIDDDRYMLPRLPEEPKADGTRYVSRPYSGDDLQKWIACGFEEQVVCEDGTGFALGAHGDWLTRDEFETWRAHILKTGFTLGKPRKVIVSVELEKELLALIEQGEFAAATTKLKQSTTLSLGKCKQWVLDHTPPPPKPQAPCPYCGKLLRSEKAQQCFECGMDWHDATNVVKHGSSVVKHGPSIRAYNFPLEWLSKRASTPEVLRQRYPHDDALAELMEGMQPGDEIRKFESPSEYWQRKSGRFGYALVREGKPVSMVVLWLN